MVAPGAFADLNVIDLDGAGRFVQRARGYDYTLVNGRVLVDHGELTEERPGHVVTPG